MLKRYFQPQFETMAHEDMVALQNEKLVAQVRHVYDHVEYYRAKMDEIGVKPEDIKSIDDLLNLALEA